MKRISFLFLTTIVVGQIFALELPFYAHPYGLIAADPRLDELGQELVMPPVSETGLVTTLNKGGGAMLIHRDETALDFIAFSKKGTLPAVDIGAAYGISSLPILKDSNCPVIVDDIGVENLLVLRKQADETERCRLYLNAKRFPEELDFPPGSIGSVLISRVFHFLRGEEIDSGLAKVYRWLAPGGKIFIVTSTPYQKNLVDFVPIYEERWGSGNPWPGHVENYGVSATALAYPNINSFLNVMDERPLRAALERAGFEVETVRIIDRRMTIPMLSLDGREGIGVIAIKKFSP